MVCPNCQKDSPITEQNYGALYTCPNCQAVYFINFEGQPEFGEITEEPLSDFVDPAEQARQESALDSLLDAASFNSAPVDFSQSDLSVSSESPAEPAYENESFDGVSNFTDTEINPFENQASSEVLSSEQGLQNDNEPLNSFANVAQEISNFGNAEVQLAGLNYDLKISGLDTQELKRLFKEAIDDSQMGWDSEELFKRIKNGSVEIEKLNPVKAYILAKRLQFLDIEKQWKQNVMS
jgi:hypothetical protein